MRRPTRTILVGKVPIGSEHPIALQASSPRTLLPGTLQISKLPLCLTGTPFYAAPGCGQQPLTCTVCLQTMTTTDTRNVAATVEQVKRCADAGADMVRITVQGRKEALACHAIREQLFKDRCAMCWPSSMQVVLM